jgi:hypothetical protein
VNVTGGQAANTILGLKFAGGLGEDTADLDYRGHIAAGALFWANVWGNDTGLFNDMDQTNNVALTYYGDMDGQFQFFLDGSGGTDFLSADLLLATGSSGTVGAPTGTALRGGGGDDTLTMRVRKNPADMATALNLSVDGGAGTDSAAISEWASGPIITASAVENLTVTLDG